MSEESSATQERAPVDVYGLLAMTIEHVSTVAWQKMGLQPDYITGKIEKDLEQCKAAIDATVALAAILEPKLDESDRRQIQNIVRDLQMNFLEKSQ